MRQQHTSHHNNLLTQSAAPASARNSSAGHKLLDKPTPMIAKPKAAKATVTDNQCLLTHPIQPEVKVTARGLAAIFLLPITAVRT